ncbi:MAG: hypothetical protein ACMUIG_03990 [Thermoplasmatota archaeon]
MEAIVIIKANGIIAMIMKKMNNITINMREVSIARESTKIGINITITIMQENSAIETPVAIMAILKKSDHEMPMGYLVKPFISAP